MQGNSTSYFLDYLITMIRVLSSMVVGRTKKNLCIYYVYRIIKKIYIYISTYYRQDPEKIRNFSILSKKNLFLVVWEGFFYYLFAG